MNQSLERFMSVSDGHVNKADKLDYVDDQALPWLIIQRATAKASTLISWLPIVECTVSAMVGFMATRWTA